MNRQNIHILIVDNNPHFLAVRAERIVEEGYRVSQALSIEEARCLLDNVWVHLAVIDVRMRDNTDTEDFSGIELATDEKYASIPKIILTDYPDYRQARLALEPGTGGVAPAIRFLTKREGASAMLREIADIVENHLRIDSSIRFHWRDRTVPSFRHLLEQIEPALPLEHLSSQTSELEDLFRRLFYGHAQVTVGDLLTGRQGQTVLEVFTFNADGIEEQFLVSCGRQGMVMNEIHTWERFLPQGHSGKRIERAAVAMTNHFAAVAYTHRGVDLGQTVSFFDFYNSHPPPDIRLTIDSLFQEALSQWHGAVPLEEFEVNPAAVYLGLAGVTFLPELHDRIAVQVKAVCREALAHGLMRIDYSSTRLVIHYQGVQSHSYPNPILALAPEQFTRQSPELIGLCHGAVSVETLRVGPDRRAWPITMAYTAVGPILFDYALLELSLASELLETEDLLVRYSLAQKLAMLSEDDAEIEAKAEESEIDKVLTVIQQIRWLAAQRVKPNLNSYRLALLYISLAHLARFDPTIRYTRRDLMPYLCTLFVASNLTGVVFGGPQRREAQPLPRQAQSSIWIDTENKEVWAQGKLVELTSQEYNILLYLYQHPNQLCTRLAIVRNALNVPHERIALEEGRLNSAMSRLRQKIERDPSRPVHISTVRGNGYKLIV